MNLFALIFIEYCELSKQPLLYPNSLPHGEDKLHPDEFLLREYQKINIF